MSTRAIGYVRVSTDDQAREGVSLDVQEARIGAYCEAKGWQLVSVVRDEGKSAKDLKRPGLQEILGALPKRQRPFDALVVVKLDRLTRSARDLGNLMEDFKRARDLLRQRSAALILDLAKRYVASKAAELTAVLDAIDSLAELERMQRSASA